jgi:hypothetical protein
LDRSLWSRLVCAIVVASSASGADWIRVASPNIEVMTDAGEKTGRDLLRYFETSRAVFQDAGISDAKTVASTAFTAAVTATISPYTWVRMLVRPRRMSTSTPY